jgi:pSer/pThr/pTyr-binding forkhead associated (FHA) protein
MLTPDNSSIFGVSLVFVEYGQSLELESPGEYVLGRQGQIVTRGGSNRQIINTADVDVSQYDGYEAGVSRRHAVLIIEDQKVSLQDLGSTNGTRVNGNTMKALSSVEIHHQDMLTLGKLKIQILIIPER